MKSFGLEFGTEYEEKLSPRRVGQAQAYAAGMPDGEGHIYVRELKNGQFQLVVTIVQSEPGRSALEYLAFRFGGKLGNPRPGRGNRKPDCAVRWAGNAAGKFLLVIRHHLRGAKIAPADLGVDFHARAEKLPGVNGVKWTEGAKERAREYRKAFRDFNRRGAFDLTGQVTPLGPAYYGEENERHFERTSGRKNYRRPRRQERGAGAGEETSEGEEG